MAHAREGLVGALRSRIENLVRYCKLHNYIDVRMTFISREPYCLIGSFTKRRLVNDDLCLNPVGLTAGVGDPTVRQCTDDYLLPTMALTQ